MALPPSVRVTFPTSQPAVGIVVRIVVRSGGGNFSSVGGLLSYQALSDIAGGVTVPVWVLGPGPNLVDAEVGAAEDNITGSPVRFSANLPTWGAPGSQTEQLPGPS